MQKINNYLAALVLSSICYLTYEYTGNKFIFFLFSIVANLTVYYFFKKKQSFFGLYMSIFLWLGMWVKMALAIVCFPSFFNVNTTIIDKALIISTLAFLALNIAIYYQRIIALHIKGCCHRPTSSLSFFYKNNRCKILLTFFILYSLIALINLRMHIYQRGLVSEYILPMHFNSVIKFLFLFGFPVVGSYLLFFDCNHKKKPYLVSMLLILEGFFSSISILSRGFIFNISSIIFGLVNFWGNIKYKKKFLCFISIVILASFVISLKIVNSLRAQEFHLESAQPTKSLFSESSTNLDFFYARWVGIEEIILVAKKNDLNFDLFKESLNESSDQRRQSFFDYNFAPERYSNVDWSKNSFISTPGVVAFLFYPGSYIFLVTGLFITFFVISLLEILANIYGGGNIIFNSLICQIIAFRMAHFGYSPLNSCLFFISILSIILLINLSNKLASKLHP